MSIEALVARFGLPALFVGAGLEGEAAVIAGGVLAHRGLVPLAGVMIVCALGSFAADQLWFALGRRFRDHRWVEAARRKPAFGRALRALGRHPVGFIFAFRFVYGFRTVSPIAIGTAGIPPRLFLPVNAAAAATWGITFSLIGYFFGKVVEHALRELRPHGTQWWWIAAALIAIGLAGSAFWWWRARRR